MELWIYDFYNNEFMVCKTDFGDQFLFLIFYTKTIEFVRNYSINESKQITNMDFFRIMYLLIIYKVDNSNFLYQK